MAQDVRVVNWEDMESTLRNTFTSVFRDSEKKDGLQQNFTSILEQHKAALVDNTEKIQNLTQAIQNLSGGIGGGGRGRPTSSTNALTPQRGEIGAASEVLDKPTQEMSSGFHPIKRAIGAIQNKISSPLLSTALGYAAAHHAGAIGSLASPQFGRELYMGVSNIMQRSVDRRVTNPVELGMAAGYQGPGYEGVAGMAGSPFGSYFSGLFAAPSLLFSGGENPGMIGSNFGAGMSQAQSEGWKTQYRAFTRSLNPFDMLSYGRAMEINQAVASKGFRNLGEQVTVEESLTDLVMKTGIEAGAALDLLDISIKRLKMDAKESADMLKEFGPLAKAAGKSVSDYTQEVTQVTSKMNALGARGPSAIQASQMYAGFTGLDASNVQAFLGGQNMTGLLAAGIMGGGVGQQFRNPKDMLKLAMGFYPGMQGGQGADEAAIAQIQSMRNLVDQMAERTGGDKDMAMFMVANMTGQDPYMIQQIYKEGPKVIRQGKAVSKMEGLVAGWNKYYGGPELRGRRATSAEGKKAFGRFKELAGQGVTDWNFDPFNDDDIWSTRGGLDFDMFDIGGQMGGNKDPEFETKVKDIYDARMRGDKEAEDAARERAEGTDAARAASLLMQAGRGKESAWKTLNQAYGIKFEGPGVTWDSTAGGVDKASRERYQKEAKDMLREFQASGAITKDQMQRIQRQLMSGKGLSPQDFQSKVNEAIASKRQRENEVKIGLSDDAKKWFNVFNKAANSSQGKFVMVAPPGVDNRATPNPGGP